MWHYKSGAEGTRRKKSRFLTDKKIMRKKKSTRQGTLKKTRAVPNFPGRAGPWTVRAGPAKPGFGPTLAAQQLCRVFSGDSPLGLPLQQLSLHSLRTTSSTLSTAATLPHDMGIINHQSPCQDGQAAEYLFDYEQDGVPRSSIPLTVEQNLQTSKRSPTPPARHDNSTCDDPSGQSTDAESRAVSS